MRQTTYIFTIKPNPRINYFTVAKAVVTVLLFIFGSVFIAETVPANTTQVLSKYFFFNQR